MFERSRSASFRASIRSLLLPSFSRAFRRGLHTISSVTCGFIRSYNQAAQVPSSKVTCRLPRNPLRKSRIVVGYSFPVGSSQALKTYSKTGAPLYRVGFSDMCRPSTVFRPTIEGRPPNLGPPAILGLRICPSPRRGRDCSGARSRCGRYRV